MFKKLGSLNYGQADPAGLCRRGCYDSFPTLLLGCGLPVGPLAEYWNETANTYFGAVPNNFFDRTGTDTAERQGHLKERLFRTSQRLGNLANYSLSAASHQPNVIFPSAIERAQPVARLEPQHVPDVVGVPRGETNLLRKDFSGFYENSSSSYRHNVQGVAQFVGAGNSDCSNSPAEPALEVEIDSVQARHDVLQRVGVRKAEESFRVTAEVYAGSHSHASLFEYVKSEPV